jgi:spore coat protein CotH
MRRLTIILLATLIPLPALGALQPASHPLFDGDVIHEINLTFTQPDWWELLRDNFEGLDDPLYLAAEFDWAGTHFDSIGVRFKGNSSYNGYPGVKKSFKLDINEYISDQTVEGLDKLNLNNCFLDPTFVREKTCYELCDALGLATVRTNYASLYINGEYWGLYLLVEQFDQEMIESRYGSDEDGNLWKGEPHGSFEYLGSSESAYYNSYELKTNEDLNDWSTLVDLIETLNFTPTDELADSLHNRVDISSALAMLAIDNFTVNLDSYIGRCANFYFYHRDLDDRFAFAKWDCNEAWGNFNMWGMSVSQLQQLSTHWVNPQSGEDRPLASELWPVAGWDEIYHGHMQKLMATAADPTVLIPRMEELRDLIRGQVQADPNKMFTNTEFEIAMYSNVQEGPRIIPALGTFVENRHTWLSGEIGTWTPPDGLMINELMAANSSTVADEHGDFDDWVEIANLGSAAVDLSGFSLTDHHDGTGDFQLPAVTLQPGEYLVIWCDEEPLEGDRHAPFKLDGDGEDLYLLDGQVIVDRVTWHDQTSDISWGRWPDGTGNWQLLSVATPGATNENPSEPEDVVLYINEFLASNSSVNQDETGAYADWVEIYNPGPGSVAMGGLFLTDDLLDTTKWIFPDTTLAAGNFMLIWCDGDPGDGPLHTTFKLSASGENIALYGRLTGGNQLIDGYIFGPQTTDISEGRLYDGDEIWTFFDSPTPGATNSDGSPVDSVTPAISMSLGNYPNPFNPHTRLQFELPITGEARLEIFDVSGHLVKTLLDGELPAGIHHLEWTGRDESGRQLASGVYLARISQGREFKHRRLVLLR